MRDATDRSGVDEEHDRRPSGVTPKGAAPPSPREAAAAASRPRRVGDATQSPVLRRSCLIHALESEDASVRARRVDEEVQRRDRWFGHALVTPVQVHRHGRRVGYDRRVAAPAGPAREPRSDPSGPIRAKIRFPFIAPGSRRQRPGRPRERPRRIRAHTHPRAVNAAAFDSSTRVALFPSASMTQSSKSLLGQRWVTAEGDPSVTGPGGETRAEATGIVRAELSLRIGRQPPQLTSVGSDDVDVHALLGVAFGRVCGECGVGGREGDEGAVSRPRGGARPAENTPELLVREQVGGGDLVEVAAVGVDHVVPEGDAPAIGRQAGPPGIVVGRFELHDRPVAMSMVATTTFSPEGPGSPERVRMNATREPSAEKAEAQFRRHGA